MISAITIPTLGNTLSMTAMFHRRSDRNGQSSRFPLRETSAKPAGLAASALQEFDCLIGKYAVWAAAVRDDFLAAWNLAQTGRQLIVRNRPGPQDVAGLEFVCGPHIERDHIVD